MDEFIKSEEAQETVLLEGHIPVEEQQSPSIVVTDFDGSNNDIDRVKSRDISGIEEQESLSLLENTSLKADNSTQTVKRKRMGMVEEMKETDFWKAIFAEFLASTLFLLNIVTVACASGMGTQDSLSASTVSIGIGIALSIATLAQVIGHISGGHINPAVTVGMMAIRKITPIKGFLYIIAQLLGAVAGSGLGYGLTPPGSRGGLGINAVSAKIDLKPVQAFGLELFFTFLLVLTVCAVTDPGKKVEPYGTTLAIGISILVCHVCLIPYTGCSVNPARSFGPAVVTNSWEDHWVFWVGPILGGVLAAILYEYVFKMKETQKSEAVSR